MRIGKVVREPGPGEFTVTEKHPLSQEVGMQFVEILSKEAVRQNPDLDFTYLVLDITLTVMRAVVPEVPND